MSALQVGTAVELLADQELRCLEAHARRMAVEVRAGACGRVVDVHGSDLALSFCVCFSLPPLVVTLWLRRGEIRPI